MNQKKRVEKLKKKIAKLKRFKDWADVRIARLNSELLLLELP